jgi:hypothetical protein
VDCKKERLDEGANGRLNTFLDRRVDYIDLSIRLHERSCIHGFSRSKLWNPTRSQLLPKAFHLTISIVMFFEKDYLKSQDWQSCEM